MNASSPKPFYDGMVANVEEAMAAAQLVGLDEELKSLREFVNNYAREHKGEFEKVLKGIRLIMQMVLAQHRIGAGELADSYTALEEATRDLLEQFAPPEIEDV